MKALLALSTLALTIASADAASPSPPSTKDRTAAGFWQQADDQGRVGAWFYFSVTKGRYDGRVVKMFPQPGEPSFDACSRCPGDLKDAPMLGLPIVRGMRRDGLKYEDGTILDPRDGSIYNAQMELSPDGQKLSVRGYIGLPLLGQTQVWTRLPDDSIPPDEIPEESVSPTAE